MLIPFIKMHAQGNDFVILDGFANHPAQIRKLDLPALARQVCMRYKEIGADGLVIFEPCRTGDAQMTIYNADGSRAEMCGSALRCVASLLRIKKNRTDLSIITDSGKKFALILPGEIVSVNLGVPRIMEANLTVEGFTGDLVNIGNPHYIIWQDNLDDDPHLKYGSILEHHPSFAKPVNVHFARFISPTEIEIKIWERGCGATLACGTGASCCVASGISRKMLEDKVEVKMPGGTVSIKAQAMGYQLAGEVGKPFEGQYNWRI